MKRLIPLLIALALVVVACGDDDASTPDVTATTLIEPPAGDGGSSSTEAPGTSEVPAESAPESGEPVAVSFTTGDGLTLDATVYPAGSDWVVLAHMLPADKTSWAELATLFQDEDYSVLAYNNRGYGASDGDREPFSLLIDAEAALEYVATQGARSVVFGGASMNGATAMTLGAGNDFDAIFLLSGVPSFPSAPDASGFLPDVEEPILFVAAEDDGSAASDARSYADSAPLSELIVLAAGGHATRMLTADPDLGARIVEWVMEVGST